MSSSLFLLMREGTQVCALGGPAKSTLQMNVTAYLFSP